MKQQLLLFVFFFLSSSFNSLGQDISPQLIPLSPTERVRYVGGYMEENNLVNSVEFDSFLQQLKIFTEQYNDTFLRNYIEYLIAGKSIFKENNIHLKIQRIKKLQDEYQKKNDLLYVGDCLIAIGQIQFIDEQYAFAFENLLAGEEILKQIGYENVPAMGKYLHNFALNYYFFQDYEKAIVYMKESVKLPEYNKNLDIQRYNTLGVSYLKLNQLDSAYIHLDIANKKAIEYKNDIWIGLTAGNIGEVLYLKGDYQKAFDYFWRDYSINYDSYSPDIQLNASINLAKIYLRLGNKEKTFHYLEIARNFFPNKTKNEAFGNQQLLELAKRNYYQVYYQYYLRLNDYKNALQYADSLHQSEKIRDKKYNILQVKMASGKLQLLQSKMELKTKEMLHERQKKVKNIIIFSFGVIFVLIVSIFKIRQKISKQKQLLLNAQLERAKYQLKLSELKLSEFRQRIQEKTKLLENFQKQSTLLLQADKNIILQLQKSSILTEDDWKRFRLLFEQVHSGFLQRLKDKYPEISPAEIRYLTLAKLGFSTKEMAAALGVSTQSIRTNWYRIRKKLNLSESLTVEELIADIG